ncbi:MAG: nitroreductase family protein [Saccharofermentanales bacterium]|jgi:heme-degrading monooxygenase HmoA
MIFVLFEVKIKKAYRAQYLDLAAEIREALTSSEGFIRSERFASLTDEGKILSLSVWENEEAVSRWRRQAAHRLAQQQGRDLMFESYRITVSGKIRSYTMEDRDEAPDDSREGLDIQPSFSIPGLEESMDLWQAIRSRHSVRRFTEQKIGSEIENCLREAVDQYNRESGLSLQLCLDEPKAFEGRLARYGRFSNCRNYLVVAGPRGSDQLLGYYGQRFVLKAQQLGLNSCWVGLHYRRSKIPCTIGKGARIRLVIALGYGQTQGRPRRSKDMMDLCRVAGEMPDWFRKGMKAALLAPTATNQQKFLLTLRGDKVAAKTYPGFYSKVDLGIVKCHFEIGAGKANFDWT